MEITKITSEQASEIIDKREPTGLFYLISTLNNKKVYVGIDNSTGDSWAEDFKSLQACEKWLKG